ncbi:hypothetical protein GMD78_06870 [Ornithinibacillus sp. L9]|uniref:UspA domain-containing protein n=1 Tax=Ornithinibacillus caprae TaxID=2678566 RepID=A0A6N8FFA4_9BACI|nr:universal stress protein [Ornithinibacillus caprae]MUK88115.1 hypothetical protein [Ornithinibacillus caprae]
MGNKVLIYANYMDGAKEAVEKAIRITSDISNLKVFLMYVFPLSSKLEVVKTQPKLSLPEVKLFQQAEAYLTQHDIWFKKIIQVGNPIQEIIMAVKFEQMDMLIVADKENKEGIGLTSSICDKVNCPVVFVREKEGDVSHPLS